jgi:imidazole glycerol phosphate synthase glutamine amidotransferase subunit
MKSTPSNYPKKKSFNSSLKKNKICKRCVMDTSDSEIFFDEKGYCNHCTNAYLMLKKYPFNLSKRKKEIVFEKIVSKIKEKGKQKEYDCVMGISGGVDSTYALYLAKKSGLKILAVHLDNGWNFETSVQNMENCLKRLKIDLYTYVLDWEEFRDIQLSFLKAGVPGLEIPTDHAIVTLLFNVAKEKGIGCVITGENFVTESIMPPSWSQGHSDWRYIKSIHKIFGSFKINTFQINNPLNFCENHFIKRIKWVRILNYVDYDKKEALKILKKEMGYKKFIEGYTNKMIVILDYGVGNPGSVLNMIRVVGGEAIISSKKRDLENAEKIVLCGFGKFDAGMKNLKRIKIFLKDLVLKKKVPILGICLGMQLFAKSSEEGVSPGLGWIDGRVMKLSPEKGHKIPHMGWNQICKRKNNLSNNLPKKSRFYFAHSYHLIPRNKKNIIMTTSYGNKKFVSGIRQGNIWGVQFHPEKSHKYGKKLMENFVKNV